MEYIWPLLVIPALIVGAGVAADLRSRRGYGLAVLAFVLLGLTIYFMVGFSRLEQHVADSEGFGVGIAEVGYLLTGIYLALVLWLGALIEVGVARHWWWLTGLLVAALLPGFNSLENNVLHLSAQQTGITGFAELLLFIFLPIVTVFAYGVFRCLRPATRREAAPAR